jgi:hypothetical protein
MVINPLKPERIFVFIDESGDPGRPDLRDSSSFYQLNIVAAARSDLQTISQHLSRFRYFLDADKEFKRYIAPRHKKKLCEISEICSKSAGIDLAIFHTTKSDYIGHYLNASNKKYSYNPRKFKNYFVRKSLEHLFRELLPTNVEELYKKGLEIKLVFDRFLESDEDEYDFKEYLKSDTRKLPSLLHITQVDSDYSDHVQFADYLGKLAKDYLVDGTHDCDLEYVEIYSMDDPEHIKAKRTPRPIGTESSSL